MASTFQSKILYGSVLWTDRTIIGTRFDAAFFDDERTWHLTATKLYCSNYTTITGQVIWFNNIEPLLPVDLQSSAQFNQKLIFGGYEASAENKTGVLRGRRGRGRGLDRKLKKPAAMFRKNGLYKMTGWFVGFSLIWWYGVEMTMDFFFMRCGSFPSFSLSFDFSEEWQRTGFHNRPGESEPAFVPIQEFNCSANVNSPCLWQKSKWPFVCVGIVVVIVFIIGDLVLGGRDIGFNGHIEATAAAERCSRRRSDYDECEKVFDK